MKIDVRDSLRIGLFCIFFILLGGCSERSGPAASTKSSGIRGIKNGTTAGSSYGFVGVLIGRASEGGKTYYDVLCTASILCGGKADNPRTDPSGRVDGNGGVILTIEHCAKGALEYSQKNRSTSSMDDLDGIYFSTAASVGGSGSYTTTLPTPSLRVKSFRFAVREEELKNRDSYAEQIALGLLEAVPTIKFPGPYARLYDGNLQVGQDATMVGYGPKNEDPLTIGTRRMGKGTLSQYHVIAGAVTDWALVSEDTRKQSVCRGDSGGPMLPTGSDEVAGLSWGASIDQTKTTHSLCAEANSDGAAGSSYELLTEYRRDFIRTTIAEACYNHLISDQYSSGDCAGKWYPNIKTCGPPEYPLKIKAGDATIESLRGPTVVKELQVGIPSDELTYGHTIERMTRDQNGDYTVLYDSYTPKVWIGSYSLSKVPALDGYVTSNQIVPLFKAGSPDPVMQFLRHVFLKGPSGIVGEKWGWGPIRKIGVSFKVKPLLSETPPMPTPISSNSSGN